MTTKDKDAPNLSKKGFLLAMTEDERKMLKTLAELEGVREESNVLRRAIRCLMETRGLEIPEGLFTDRSAGNRLPKSDHQPTLNQMVAA